MRRLASDLWTFTGLRHLSFLLFFGLLLASAIRPICAPCGSHRGCRCTSLAACSSCASAHHHNCKRCSSSSVFASVQSINCVTLLAARPFRCEACGFLMSFVLDPLALQFCAFQESDIDSSAVHFVCALALVAVAHAFPHWLA